MENLETFQQWVAQSSRIVAFTGAGVSTESGIKDFRSVDGLYNQKFEYPPESIISHSFFEKMPEYFFRFYREKMLPLGFEPNVTHRVLARWETEGKLNAVVTQNIDGLHQKAGSKTVYELHGSAMRNYCTRCRKSYSAEFVRDCDGVPRCSCGGSPTRPNVFPSSIEKLTSFTAFKICFGLPQKERFTTKSLCRFLTSNKFIKIPPYSLWVQIHAPTNILHNDLYLIVSFLASTAYIFSLLLYSV